jgi:hypothetical protein
MSEDSEDKFTSGYFWMLYQDLERQFQDFLRFIPYLDGPNLTAYSFKLVNLILSIGGHIDSCFKEMARYPDFAENEMCKRILYKMEKSEHSLQSGKPPEPISIRLCLEAFEGEYKLSKKYVVFKRIPVVEVVIPFGSWGSKEIPEWWKTYNDLKHDVSVNIEKATLRNARDALAGAFLLNVVHIPSASRMFKYGLIEPNPEVAENVTKGTVFKFYITREEKLKEFYKKHKRFLGVVNTPLFAFAHEQGSE